MMFMFCATTDDEDDDDHDTAKTGSEMNAHRKVYRKKSLESEFGESLTGAVCCGRLPSTVGSSEY